MPEVEAYPEMRTSPVLPAQDYERWREQSPLKQVRLANGQDIWLVLQQEAARQVLDQTDSLTSDMTAPGFPLFRAGKPSGNPATMMTRMDPPHHAAVRKYFASFFTAKRIAAWKPEIERIVDQAIADLVSNGSPADLLEQFAIVIPSHVFCMLLGVEYELSPDFRRLAEANTSALISADKRNAGIAELYDLIEVIFAEQRKHPTAGIISELIRMVDAGKLTHEAAVGNTFVLANGGQDTTASSIALGALQLMQNPHLVARINDEPHKMPVLVEEMIRTQSIIGQVIGRAATKPITVGEEVIEAGEGLVVTPEAANHDPRVYPNPHEIDLDRDVSVGHVAFGSGIHSCLGQNLARAELQTVFSRLFQRIPTLHLAENDPPEFDYNPFIFGVRRLPVEW
jgi:cytochrome P450